MKEKDIRTSKAGVIDLSAQTESAVTDSLSFESENGTTQHTVESSRPVFAGVWLFFSALTEWYTRVWTDTTLPNTEQEKQSQQQFQKTVQTIIPKVQKLLILILLLFAVQVGILTRDILHGLRTTFPVLQTDIQNILQNKTYTLNQLETLQNDLVDARNIVEQVLPARPVFIHTPSYMDQGRTLLDLEHEVFVLTKRAERLRGIWEHRQHDKNLIATLHLMENDMSLLNERIPVFHELLDRLDPQLLPASLTGVLEYIQSQKKITMQAHDWYKKYYHLLFDVLGEWDIQRTLVLFQNSAEIRPTGGFLWSFVLLDTLGGEMTLKPIDVYKLDGQLAEKIEIPTGLQGVSDNFYLRDANYWPDFPTSAKKIAWFLEKEGGPTADHIIALDQRILKPVLEFLWPVALPQYGVTMTADNYYYILVTWIESKRTGVQNPKQILFDMAHVLFERFQNLSWKEKIDFFTTLTQSVEIQAYSKNPEVEAFFQEIGIDGAQYKPQDGDDFFQVVHTSIGGNKSDFYIEERYAHDTIITENGTIQSQLSINRAHHWTEKEAQIWETFLEQPLKKYPNLRFVFGDAENIAYTRVYLPPEAKVLQVIGIDPQKVGVFRDQDWTVVFFPFQVLPWRDKTARILYELPEKNETSYHFVTEKQKGLDAVSLQKTLQVPSGWSINENNSSQITWETLLQNKRVSTTWNFAKNKTWDTQ